MGKNEEAGLKTLFACVNTALRNLGSGDLRSGRCSSTHLPRGMESEWEDIRSFRGDGGALGNRQIRRLIQHSLTHPVGSYSVMATGSRFAPDPPSLPPPLCAVHLYVHSLTSVSQAQTQRWGKQHHGRAPVGKRAGVCLQCVLNNVQPSALTNWLLFHLDQANSMFYISLSTFIKSFYAPFNPICVKNNAVF